MNFLDILLMALGLSMDAFAVSIANAAACSEPKPGDSLRMGLYFGGFQGVMPIIGFLLGSAFAELITAMDHWIALILLSFIGGKMVYESFSKAEEKPKIELTNQKLLIQAVATSIDALAVGITIALMGVSIWFAAAIIALVTFVMVFMGGKLGKKLGTLFQKRATLTGGIVLILIGLKIFIQDLFL